MKKTYTLTIKLLMLLLLGLPMVAWAQQNSEKLVGTPIGSQAVDYSTGKVSTTVNIPDCAFDGDLSTFYASYDRSNTWVGLDLGSAHVITKIGWCPRSGQPSRVQLGVFEGSNSEDFLDAVPLYVIPGYGTNGQLTYQEVNVSRGFRYVRYVGPADARCNIGELEFYGYEGEGDDSQFYQITNLPTLSIHTYNGQDPTSKTVDLESNITITYDGGTRIQEYPVLARTRGNASNGFPKKPYRIKFNDGKSHKMLKGSALESPAKAKKWTLINNYGDKTLMRNCVAFEMSRRLGMPYTTYCQPVDVLVNGEYHGCYQLCDQITVDANRVNVTEMTPEDILEPELTGGYLVEIDAYASRETSWFTSNKGIPVTIKSPGEEEITSQQSNYIRGAFNVMESALWSSTFKDEETGYRKYLNLEEFLRHFIVGEFSGNTDTYWSVYMYKDREEDQFHVGPVWDFDLAFNNDNRIYPVSNRSNWVYCSGGSCASGVSTFVSRILSDSYADKRLKQIWAEMRQSGAFTDESLVAYVDSMAQEISASAQLNFIRWPILNTTVHQNVTARGSYKAEVDVLRDYLPERINWIDEFLGYGGGGAYVDSTYTITNAEQLVEFATAVSKGANGSVGILMADIDMTVYNEDFKPIGTGSKPFCGTFNGNGHKIKNLVINTPENNVGLFGTVTGGATISNLILDSSCSITGGSYTGVIGVTSGSGLVTIDRVGNEADITGGQNTAGIIGCNMGSTCQFIITDCYNTGNISGTRESAAICGWVGTNATIQNCWNVGTVTGIENESRYFYRGGATATNDYSKYGSQVTTITDEQVSSGELCYLLNDGNIDKPVWYQRIGKDVHPSYQSSRGLVCKDDNGKYYNLSDRLGDVNGDGEVDQTDAADIALDIMYQTPDGFLTGHADVNSDNRNNVLDVVGALRIAKVGSANYSPELTGRIYSSNASVKAGGSRKVTVWINTSSPVTAYQVDIQLSDGLSIDPSSVALGTIYDASHIKMVAQKDNVTRLLVYSPALAALTVSTGTAFTFTLQGNADFTGGSISFKNQSLITATGQYVNAASSEYTVSLAKTYVTGIAVDPAELILINGKDAQLSATVEPATATVKTLKWTTADSSVATVGQDGLVTAVGLGQTTITVASTDGSNIKTIIPVTVQEDPDGILHIEADLSQLEIYTLSGVKVNQVTRKGFYIVNGKKVLIK